MAYSVPSPGDFIRDELKSRGWTQADLARIIDRPLPTVNEIIGGKRAVMPEMAVALGMAFGNDAQLWMSREATYRLSFADTGSDEVRRRAHLYEIAPIKEMEKRGWIRPTDNIDELERELKRFFGVETLDQDPIISAATRKSDSDEDLTASQRAWCFRIRQLAKSLAAPAYNPDALGSCKKQLRTLAAYPQEAHKLSDVLRRFGIRFVVAEPLAGTKVDGVAMWLDKESPVIGMSLRYDRIDSFWFTLCHELSHIEHRDDAPLDVDLTDRMEGVTVVRSATERRANTEAADLLVPKKELDSFILRVGPLYSKDKIVRFAHRVKMHPGVIVGQLQRRDEIGYHANREMLAKIRSFVISATITDGWGHILDPRSIG